jgi:hypothetical protein
LNKKQTLVSNLFIHMHNFINKMGWLFTISELNPKFYCR